MNTGNTKTRNYISKKSKLSLTNKDLIIYFNITGLKAKQQGLAFMFMQSVQLRINSSFLALNKIE